MPGTPLSPIEPSKTSLDGEQKRQKVSETAIPDIARYQEQLLRMILHHDDRALRVPSLYVTALGALVTTLFAMNQARLITPNIVALISGASLTLMMDVLLHIGPHGPRASICLAESLTFGFGRLKTNKPWKKRRWPTPTKPSTLLPTMKASPIVPPTAWQRHMFAV
jgi:hypothetical protein